MKINFWKMQGLGNDLMVLNLDQQPALITKMTPELICAWGDRHFGVGFDQLMAVSQQGVTDPSHTIFVRIFNADGKEVQQCGNGMRCVARFAKDMGIINKNQMELVTKTGIYEAILKDNGEVKVDMRPPILQPTLIPFKVEQQSNTSSTSSTYSIQALNTEFKISALSMGNPHCILMVDSILKIDVNTIGAALSQHPDFPEQANVSFMQVISPDHVLLRVYERGVGETMACGSGACAAVVAGRLRGQLAEEVRVDLSGGSLQVQWSGDDQSVWLTGPAVKVFEGIVEVQ